MHDLVHSPYSSIWCRRDARPDIATLECRFGRRLRSPKLQNEWAVTNGFGGDSRNSLGSCDKPLLERLDFPGFRAIKFDLGAIAYCCNHSSGKCES